jgi:hypothetical protein
MAALPENKKMSKLLMTMIKSIKYQNSLRVAHPEKVANFEKQVLMAAKKSMSALVKISS